MDQQALNNNLWGGTYTPEDIDAAEQSAASGALDQSALSSILYSYATRLRAQGDVDGYKLYQTKAVAASDMAAASAPLTTAQLDVRQSILRDVGRNDEAAEVIKRALTHTDIPPHTYALLRIGLSEVLHALGRDEESKAEIEHLVPLLPQLAIDDDRQNIRVYRGLVRYFKRIGDTQKMDAAKESARALITKTGAEDQKLKLEHDLR